MLTQTNSLSRHLCESVTSLHVSKEQLRSFDLLTYIDEIFEGCALVYIPILSGLILMCFGRQYREDNPSTSLTEECAFYLEFLLLILNVSKDG